MQRNCCHLSFASILKIFNFLQAFLGVSIIIYSIWMLDQYNHQVPVDPPPSPPTAYLPDFSSPVLSSGIEIVKASEPLKNSIDFGSGYDHGFSFLGSLDLPAPWFIYSFMAVGILVCIVTFIGFIAAEAINGCCLCFYSILKTLVILLEVALVAFIAIDHHWEKDLPYDPTGELDSLRAFIEENIDICKWVGIAVVSLQLLSLLLAMVLRAMVTVRKPEFNEEDDFENQRSRTYDPLLASQSKQTAVGSSKIENWSSRIRGKYGLNQSDAVNPKG